MRAALTATALALCATTCAAVRDAPTPQLNLQPCNSTAQTAALSWAYAGGAFSLRGSTPLQCATYDPVSTNLVMSACASLPTQAFTLRADGTILSPSTGQCWDSQYYSNSTGGGLGLYTCEPGQHWDLFAYDSTTGLLTYNSTPGLCVSGGFPPPPLPTAQQLAWMDTEVSLMISFDIVTSLTEVPNPQHFCIQAGGDSGFPVPPASRFAPSSDVDFTQSWMAAAAAADARYTLLVASHCSGFFQWQSNVTLPDGTPYPYTVAQSAWKGGKGDVVSDYVAASRAAGLPFGFYLTWNYNYLFNRGPSGEAKTPLQPGQVSVSDEQYHAMMLAQMEEVWTRYPGAITEIWFDGGENNDAMNALIQRLQPQAIAADGTQAPNVARLVGGESGYAPYPVWSTTNRPAEDGSGDMMGAYFCPAEADTPVAAKDAWFWKPSQAYRPLQELYSVYKNTVGANSLLELGVLPDATGAIPADQMAVLQGLGDYIRACHSPAAALASANGTTASLHFAFPPAWVDRVVLQEELALGQLVQAFTVSVDAGGGYSKHTVQVAQGSAIGHKRILYFSTGPIWAEGLYVDVQALYPGYTEANFRSVAVYSPCAMERQ